jgi:hypothetical protein
MSRVRTGYCAQSCGYFVGDQSPTKPVASSTSAARLSLKNSKRKGGLALEDKATVLRNNLNLDGAPIVSKSHTHPSHSQTSRLLTSSLSLGVPVPRPTQCVRGAFASSVHNKQRSWVSHWQPKSGKTKTRTVWSIPFENTFLEVPSLL